MMGIFHNPFLKEGFPLPALNPTNDAFSANAWLSNLVGFTQENIPEYKHRSAGIALRNLEVHGFGSPTDYQKNVGNVLLECTRLFRWMGGQKNQRIQILKNFDGLVKAGELCLVLGRPGAGCSTLLKTISGDTHGFHIGTESVLNYQGIPASQMHTQFRGEAIYMAENDVHFPQLTVGETLLFAAKARAPRDNTFPGITRDMWARHLRDVIMATFGIRHTINTPVGGVLIKGVSGGERKRVSIAEAILGGSPLQCWDNSTRGLDSANALEFCKTVRLSTSFLQTTAFVSLYQGSQDAYEIFDKVTLLYEGRQIYFGPCNEARDFFVKLGFECAPRQTTADFLTALTSPSERRIRPGFEKCVPHTAEEFACMWRSSETYEKLIEDIDQYHQKFPIDGQSVNRFVASRKSQQARQQRVNSPYTLSLRQQVKICVDRGFQRLRGDSSVTISRVVANAVLALVVGSMFYNLDETTDSFYSRSVLIFLSILLNAFASALEILIIFDQRPIVEKHARYAYYHPFAEAVASTLCDMPFKICNALFFNLVLYFMSNLRREPGAFFVFLLFSFSMTVSLSMVFRTFGASSRTLASSLFPSTITILALMTYTGFVVPIGQMHPWFRWINYIDPIAYAFESLMINEYHGRNFTCSPESFVPAGPDYLDVGGLNRICAAVGAAAGSDVVSGTDYIRLSFNYRPGYKWRNLGIILALTVFFTFTYFASTEYITAKKSKGEILLFQRGRNSRKTADMEQILPNDTRIGSIIVETESSKLKNETLLKQTSVFQWKNICYDIKIKKEDRRILDRVDGWVAPGTLTALMGPSGAGKTTLLDVLATRDTIGIASGEALVDGRPRDISFQRKTGYAQQSDIHLETMTVREAMRFNAVLCQPESTPKKEKLRYVDEIINLLDMESYADAIVGVPGEGLNIEQRKKLTIAVELAARPQLLLFLDEPSSGLDSQTSWAVLDLLEKLTSHGQAILCTIHQPSAALFERFDRLLFLAPEGKPVYFGDIGKASRTIIDYFERNGVKPCPPDSNPAEWIMEIIGCTPGSHSVIDWPEVWRNSPEFVEVRRKLDYMALHGKSKQPLVGSADDRFKEFASPISVQLWECLKRVNQQYWRTPSYIYSKAAMCIGSALFLGFTFYNSDNSLQGLQDQTFNIFMLVTLSSNFVPQMLPNFVTQRSIYEARERPAKTYSWPVFLLSNILVELPWNALMAVLIYLAWYYPSGLYRNAQYTDTVTERSATVFLLMLAYMMFTSTFGHMVQAGVELADMGGNYANLLFMLSLIFCGVLIGPNALPKFWIFMYRVSPFTYLVSAVLSTGLANAPIQCSPIELLHFDPVPNTTCATYLSSYLETAGGLLTNPEATENCAYCPLKDTNAFLKLLSSEYGTRWRDFGILWVYVGVNIGLAMFWYWLARVPRDRRKGVKQVMSTADNEKIEEKDDGQAGGGIAVVQSVTETSSHHEAQIQTGISGGGKTEGKSIPETTIMEVR